MARRFRLNRMDVFALLAVVVTTLLFVGAALDAASLYLSVRHMPAADRAVGCFGWLVATFAPITLAILFWRWANNFRKAWMLHLLMFPLSLATIKLGGSLMLSVIGSPDFDDTLGGPVLQAGVLFLLAMIGYYSAVLYTAAKRRSGISNGI